MKSSLRRYGKQSAGLLAAYKLKSLVEDCSEYINYADLVCTHCTHGLECHTEHGLLL